MNDLFMATFEQVPELSKTYTISQPDILGNMTISGLNGNVGSISSGVLGESIVEMNGEKAVIGESAWGNYQVETDEGTYTAIDNAYGGDSLLHFGETVAYSRPGLFETENWYDASTNELLASNGIDGLGQATITLPADFDTYSFDALNDLDSFSFSSEFVNFSDAISGSSDFLGLLEFI